jgi:ketopantoate reductase
VKIRIVGPGAVGMLFGGLLAEAGHEVTLVGRRPEHCRAREQGVRLVLPDRWLVARPGEYCAGTETRIREPADLVVVALRRDHLRELRTRPGGAAILQAPLPEAEAGSARGGDAPVLFLNASEQDTRDWFPDLYRRTGAGVMHALTLWNAVRLQPDTVELTSRRSILLTARHPLLKFLGPALRGTGVEIAEADGIGPWHESFFLWQLLFLPVALCHATWDYFLSFTEGREIAARVTEEGLRALERAGGDLRKLPVMDPQELLVPARRGRRAAAGARFDPDRGYNSLLQSLLRGEKTEVRELNERLVRKAAEVGVEAPWNWKLARKASRASQVGFYRNPAELYQALS